MTELIIIKTDSVQAVSEIKKILEEKHISYETYQDNSSQKKITNEELGQAYKEAYSNPQRYQEAQKWEKAAVSDWAEGAKKDK